MPKKISNSYNPPFRLQSEIKFHYQRHFLQYINELAPKVSIETRKLTERCEELFGKFPELINTTKDNSNFYIAYPADSDSSPSALAQRNLQNDIDSVFTHCIYKESRKNSGHYGWQQTLTKFDDELNKANEIQNKYIENAKSYVTKELSENFDTHKLEYAAATNFPTEEVTESTLSFWLSRSFYQSLRESDKDYGKAMELIEAKIEKLKKFQNDFDTLLDRLCLNKPWLARSIFRAIWNGTGKMQMESNFWECIPEKLIDEIKNRLEIKHWPLITQNEERTIRVSYQNNIPLPNAFEYLEPYWIYDSFEEYENKAIEDYRQHLRTYFSVIKESFEKFGYKQPRKPYDYTRVKWLVRWTVQEKKIQEIAEEFRIEERTVWDAFETFKNYDLPVRKKNKTEVI